MIIFVLIAAGRLGKLIKDVTRETGNLKKCLYEKIRRLDTFTYFTDACFVSGLLVNKEKTQGKMNHAAIKYTKGQSGYFYKIDYAPVDMFLEESNEPWYCAYFGCAKKLTMQERMCGKYCQGHSNKKAVDPTYFISY